jgi:hypothetical protein
MKAAGIHCQVYVPNTMSDCKIHKLVKLFMDRRMNICDVECSCQLSLVTDD